MKTFFLLTLIIFSAKSQASNLASIKLNPLSVDLSSLASDSIKAADKDFAINKFEDYTEKVHKVFLEDSESLDRETPMAVLGYFDCDNTLDLAVMGTARGKDVIMTLLSTNSFKAVPVTGLLKEDKAVKNSSEKRARYLSLNQNIPLKPSTCRGARTTIDLIQSEEVFSGDTHAFYYKKGKWVKYVGQDL